MEKDELLRRLTMLQHKDTQYQHELRKKERLYDTLKDRMNTMLIEKNREVKNSMEILVALQKEDKKRSTSKTQKTVTAKINN
jgi:X breakpoint 2-interacting protein